MARIGYAKIGRSWNLDPAKATSVGGDIDVINLLNRLARQFPEHEFVLVGKNSGEDPAEFGYPSNITNPWTEWKKEWKVAEDPRNADLVIEQFRKIAGNFHETLDEMIVWAGQHGSANSRIPMIGSDWTTPPGWSDDTQDNAHNDIITGGFGETLATPQFCFIHYCSWLLDFIGRWREAGPGPTVREEIWLCPDPRNYLKIREKRWPIRFPVLAQYEFLKYHKSERYGRFPPELEQLDPTGYRENSLWVSNVAYCYSGLELTAVGDPDKLKFDPIPGPHKFGMVVNENLVGVKYSRLQLLKEWVLPYFPDAEIRGHWTEKSQLDLNRVFNPVPYPEVMGVMKSFATTLTTPASGSGWATAKPWEAFAIGSVCFFHPRYDDQGYILPTEKNIDDERWCEDAKMLGRFLRVSGPEQLAERVEEVTSNPDLYYAIVTAQRRYYERSFEEWQGGARAVANRIVYDLTREQTKTVIMDSAEREPWLQYTTPVAAKVATRLSARPRGTNEERKKKKPPVSRRRAIRQEVMDEAREGSPEVNVEFVQATPEVSTSPMQITATPADAFFSGYSLPSDVSRGVLSLLSLEVNHNPDLSFRINPKSARQSKDEYFIDIAKKVATQTTCLRRAVGCVLVSSKKKILATGYNGVPRGMPHCNEGQPCAGANMPSGEGLSDCLSVHAEINALIQCAEVDDIETVYLTVSPCRDCLKAIMNTGARRIVFQEEYVQQGVRERWLSIPGNEWLQVQTP